VRQLAERWKWDEQDVRDCIRTGALQACVLLHGVYGHAVDDPDERLWLDEGHYRLPPVSAAALFGWSGGDEELEPLQVIKEPDLRVTLAGSAVYGAEIRLLREEAERFEREHMADGVPGEDSNPSRPSQRARESVRAVAALLWQQDATRNLNIRQMIERPELTKCLELGGHHRGFTHDTIRDWIHDLCPDPKPGRPPKAN
jgi:hypothetical protein